MTARPNWQRQGGFASLMQEITPGMNASDAPTVDELLLVAEGSVEFLFGTSRAALLQISSPLSTSESKAWLSAQNVDAKLAKVGRSMPQALKNTLYFYSFQKPCEELLRKASVDPAEAADWAFYSGRWYLTDASDHCVTKAEFTAVQTSARTFLHQLDAAQLVSNGSPAPAMPFALAVDGKKLMSRFFQLRGSWVQEVASAAAAVVTDAELQTDIKIIGRAYALQAAQFDSFYPRFVEALDAASRGQSNPWDAAKFLADGHFKFFAAFARGILGGAQSGPTMAATSIGATAPGLVVPVPWAAPQQTAASVGAQSAGPSLLVALAPGALPGAGVTGSPLQVVAQHSQPGAALWSTISSFASQIGGPIQAGVLNSADAARAAMFMSQLAALQPPAQAAALPSPISPPPAYVAPRAEGAPPRQPRSSAQAHAALNRNDVWIPYSTAIFGPHSPYPEVTRTLGRPNCASCATFLTRMRVTSVPYLINHGVPAHRNSRDWPVSTAEIAAPQPPERRGRAP